MNFLRKWIRNLLGFSGRETNAFIILLPLILIIISIEPVYRTWISNRPIDYYGDQKKLDGLTALLQVTPNDTVIENTYPKVSIKKELFQFNPNTASAEELKRLGFPDFLARRLVSYRQNGGKFNTSADLNK